MNWIFQEHEWGLRFLQISAKSAFKCLFFCIKQSKSLVFLLSRLHRKIFHMEYYYTFSVFLFSSKYKYNLVAGLIYLLLNTDVNLCTAALWFRHLRTWDDLVCYISHSRSHLLSMFSYLLRTYLIAYMSRNSSSSAEYQSNFHFFLTWQLLQKSTIRAWYWCSPKSKVRTWLASWLLVGRCLLQFQAAVVIKRCLAYKLSCQILPQFTILVVHSHY